MWNTDDCWGKPATWYSKEEAEKIIFDLKLVLKCVKEVASKAGSECGIADDYFKRKNYSQKQEQIKMLINKFEQICKLCDEVLTDEKKTS